MLKLKNDFRKITKAAIAISIAICIISASSVSGGMICDGSSSWSGNDGGGVTNGKCDNSDGTYSQTRTVGTCVYTGLLVFCISDNYSQTRSRTVTQNSVTGTALALCQSEQTECEDAVDILYGVCALECLLFLPNIPAVAACEALCYIARSLDMAACHDAYDECVFDCEISSWSYSNSTYGCIMG